MFPSLHWIGTDPDEEVLFRDDPYSLILRYTYLAAIFIGVKSVS